MSEQIINFQRLASRAGDAPNDPSGPRTVIVAGGKAGAGATTIAMHLAQALAQDAHRIVLVDANLQHADIAARCGLTVTLGIGDVLAGRKTIHEVLHRGPAGMHVLSGPASPELRSSLTERSIQRLLRQMRALGPHADCLIIDAGHEPSEFTRRLWTTADRLLLVTSPDAAAVMDTYAVVKTLLSRQPLRKLVSLVVNRSPDEATAADVHRRIDQSCRRFLGLSVEYSGGLPTVPAAKLAGSLFDSSHPLSQTLARLARQIVQVGPAASTRRAA